MKKNIENSKEMKRNSNFSSHCRINKSTSVLEDSQTINIPNKINEIAKIVLSDWKNINYGAQPYLEAMKQIEDITSNYYEDSAKTIVGYFLANAQSWRGATAKAVKTKLKELVSEVN